MFDEQQVIFDSALLLLVFVLAACGANEDKTEIENESGNVENASASEVDLVATDWDFDQGSESAEAGEVTINLTNEEGHDQMETTLVVE